MKLTARVSVLLAVTCLLLGANIGLAQREVADQSHPLTKRADIYCTGFISDLPPRTNLRIIGGEKETIRRAFAQGDVVYLNKGREQGVYPGAAYYVIRPVGKFNHPFTRKKLGHYVRELGIVRVLEVQNVTATAEVIISCDTITLGDLLKPYEALTSPNTGDGHPLARYSEGVGGTTGQIIMSRGYYEFLSANQVVHIDLGHNQGVRPGDSFTIFRTIPGEGTVQVREHKTSITRSDGFESNRYRGGRFSIYPDREPAEKIFRERPTLPRKVVGEMIVLKVENSTAVAIITRTLEEVNIGDFVERMN